jgi:uncharacterized coiled-coil protein SlyX
MAANYKKDNAQFDPVGAEHIIRELNEKVVSTKKALHEINDIIQQIVDIAGKHDIDIACVVSVLNDEDKDHISKRMGVLLSSDDPEMLLDAVEALVKVLYSMVKEDKHAIDAMERYIKTLVSYKKDSDESMALIGKGKLLDRK